MPLEQKNVLFSHKLILFFIMFHLIFNPMKQEIKAVGCCDWIKSRLRKHCDPCL